MPDRLYRGSIPERDYRACGLVVFPLRSELPRCGRHAGRAGVFATYETVRRWCDKFGKQFADGIRRRRARTGDKWHLDEVFLKINGVTHYLWRAVDQNGVVLDILVQPKRDRFAAMRFFRLLLVAAVAIVTPSKLPFGNWIGSETASEQSIPLNCSTSRNVCCPLAGDTSTAKTAPHRMSARGTDCLLFKIGTPLPRHEYVRNLLAGWGSPSCDSLAIFTGEGSLTFAAPTFIGHGTATSAALALDTHGQRKLAGRPDLVVPDATGVVYLYLNTTK